LRLAGLHSEKIAVLELRTAFSGAHALQMDGASRPGGARREPRLSR
jgi:hypothetical protein